MPTTTAPRGVPVATGTRRPSSPLRPLTSSSRAASSELSTSRSLDPGSIRRPGVWRWTSLAWTLSTTTAVTARRYCLSPAFS